MIVNHSTSMVKLTIELPAELSELVKKYAENSNESVNESAEFLALLGDFAIVEFERLGRSILSFRYGIMPIDEHIQQRIVWNELGIILRGITDQEEAKWEPFSIDFEHRTHTRFEHIAKDNEYDIKEAISARIRFGWDLLNKCTYMQDGILKHVDTQEGRAHIKLKRWEEKRQVKFLKYYIDNIVKSSMKRREDADPS